MKKLILALLSTAMVLTLITTSCIANEEIKVYLEGQKIDFDVPPQTVNDRTMVPIRAIFEAMGASVEWDNATQTATSTKDGTTVKMTLNSTTEYINDKPVAMDVAPVVIGGRTLAPARYVAEAFGYYVGWDSMTQSVLIGKNTNFDISQVKDGTREHPYKFGDKVTLSIFGYADNYDSKTEKAVMEITLNSVQKFDAIKSNFPEKSYYMFEENDWFVNGSISLIKYTEDNAYNFYDIKYNTKLITNNLTTIDVYSFFSDPTGYNILSLYPGGTSKVYIPIDTKDLSDGQTFDYLTITYSFGSNYSDKKTIWFSLK